MLDNLTKSFEQAASFQKIWMDSLANMAGTFSQLSPASPPTDQLRLLRGSMLKVLSETWNEFMRSPQFMEMMKLSLNGAFDLRGMLRENMNRIHDQFETPSKEDLDGVLLAIRHVERRTLERLEGMEERLASQKEILQSVDERMESLESLEPRIARLIQKLDQKLESSEPKKAKASDARSQASTRGSQAGVVRESRGASERGGLHGLTPSRQRKTPKTQRNR